MTLFDDNLRLLPSCIITQGVDAGSIHYAMHKYSLCLKRNQSVDAEINGCASVACANPKKIVDTERIELKFPLKIEAFAEYRTLVECRTLTF